MKAIRLKEFFTEDALTKPSDMAKSLPGRSVAGKLWSNGETTHFSAVVGSAQVLVREAKTIAVTLFIATPMVYVDPFDHERYVIRSIRLQNGSMPELIADKNAKGLRREFSCELYFT